MGQACSSKADDFEGPGRVATSTASPHGPRLRNKKSSNRRSPQPPPPPSPASWAAEIVLGDPTLSSYSHLLHIFKVNSADCSASGDDANDNNDDDLDHNKIRRGGRTGGSSPSALAAVLTRRNTIDVLDSVGGILDDMAGRASKFEWHHVTGQEQWCNLLHALAALVASFRFEVAAGGESSAFRHVRRVVVAPRVLREVRQLLSFLTKEEDAFQQAEQQHPHHRGPAGAIIAGLLELLDASELVDDVIERLPTIQALRQRAEKGSSLGVEDSSHRDSRASSRGGGGGGGGGGRRTSLFSRLKHQSQSQTMDFPPTQKSRTAQSQQAQPQQIQQIQALRQQDPNGKSPSPASSDASSAAGASTSNNDSPATTHTVGLRHVISGCAAGSGAAAPAPAARRGLIASLAASTTTTSNDGPGYLDDSIESPNSSAQAPTDIIQAAVKSISTGGGPGDWVGAAAALCVCHVQATFRQAFIVQLHTVLTTVVRAALAHADNDGDGSETNSSSSHKPLLQGKAAKSEGGDERKNIEKVEATDNELVRQSKEIVEAAETAFDEMHQTVRGRLGEVSALFDVLVIGSQRGE